MDVKIREASGAWLGAAVRGLLSEAGLFPGNRRLLLPTSELIVPKSPGQEVRDPGVGMVGSFRGLREGLVPGLTARHSAGWLLPAQESPQTSPSE